jgi:hypothetical protein
MRKTTKPDDGTRRPRTACHDLRIRALPCLALAAGALGGVVAQQAAAQSLLDVARRCAAIAAADQRLACYDAVLGATPSDSAPTAPAAKAAPQARTVEPPAANPAAEEPAASRVAARAAPPPPAPQAAAREKKADADAAMPIVVVDIHDVANRSRVFTTEAGDTWVQTSGEHIRYADVPFRAEIRPGALGSHFLVPQGRGRAVRVTAGE